MMIDLPEKFNLTDHFIDRHVREGRGGRTAIVCNGRRFAYAELAKKVSRVGNGLRRLGVQKGQRVFFVLPDGPEFAAAYFGVIKIGAVAIPTNTALRADDYASILTESRAKVLIVHDSLYAEFAPALACQPYLQHVVVQGGSATLHLDWDDWLTSCSPELDSEPTKKNDVAFWLWTSGSTGRPKASVHQQRDWLYCCEGYSRGVLDMGPDDVTFSSSKLFHAYGLGNGLMFPFYVGATTVLYPGKPHAKVILETAQNTRPTLFFSVPTLYAAMLHEIERGERFDLCSVRLAISAAEPLPADIFRRWKERFDCEILDGIGSTEVLHMYLSARARHVRPGSTGQPVPGYDIRVVGPDGQDLPPLVVGDLLVSGESTAQCYWNHPDLTRDRMRGRWFFTGDKYSVDEDGYFWYAGRADDLFRVSGQWVSPVEIESALIRHTCVLEAAVVAYEEETKLHTPKAFVVLKQGVAGNSELVRELQDFVKKRITPYKYPRRIEFVTDLPKTATGKLQRYKLRG